METNNKTKKAGPVIAGLVLLSAFFVAGMLFASNNDTSLGGGSGGGKPVNPVLPPGEEPVSVDMEVLEVARDELVRGDGDVWLIEYSDYECSFCQRFHSTAQSLVDSGEVTWVYRHFPLPFHATADDAARLAECIRLEYGASAGWTFTDAIFTASQPGVGLYRQLAADAGLSPDQIEACIAPDQYPDNRLAQDAAAVVSRHGEDVSKIGINGTPGSYLVNKKTGDYVNVPGAVPLENLRELLSSVQ